MPCAGYSGLTCGGSYAIDVYSAIPSSSTTSSTTTTTTSSATASPKASYYVGCYADSDSRTLSGASTSSSSNTPGSCLAYCTGQGYAYAGAEYGDEVGPGASTAPEQADVTVLLWQFRQLKSQAVGFDLQHALSRRSRLDVWRAVGSQRVFEQSADHDKLNNNIGCGDRIIA